MLTLRNFAGLAALFAITFSSVGFGPPALIESNEARTPLYPYEVGLARQVKAVPPTSAKSIVILDGTSGKVFYAKDAHDRLAPASLTKIMTAILAIENGNLNDYVQVNVDSLAMDGSSVMGLRPGEVLTLEGLLYGLLLPSGNDAAVAIAQYIDGSEERFVARMNQKAQDLGLKDTHFANPHGLDEANHYSSAYDLAMLGRYAMQNPTFARIVGTRAFVVKGKATYSLQNVNQFLGQYNGADGVKTGTTDNAKQALVASVKRNGRHVFVAMIRSDDRYLDAQTLFDYFFKNFVWVPMALPQSPFYNVAAPDGAARTLTADTDRAEPLPVWEKMFLRSFVTVPNAEQAVDQSKAGDTIGPYSASFYLGNEKLGDVPVRVESGGAD